MIVLRGTSSKFGEVFVSCFQKVLDRLQELKETWLNGCLVFPSVVFVVMMCCWVVRYSSNKRQDSTGTGRSQPVVRARTRLCVVWAVF